MEADGTEGTPPQFTSIFPSASTVYLSAGENFAFGGIFWDDDLDADHIEVYLDNVKINEDFSISGDSSFDFYVSSSFLPTSGTHQLKAVPVDAGGKQGDAKTWSLVISAGGHAPQIRRVIPNSTDSTYVLNDGSTTLYVFVEDQDGDLDLVVWDRSDVGGDSTIETSVSGFFDASHKGFNITTSGVVTATVYDEGGRSSSTTFNITMVDEVQNNPPEILNCNIPDGEFDRIINDSSYDVALEFDAFDRDGDLLKIELFQNDVLIASKTNINDYEDDNSFLSTGNETYFDSFEGPENLTKGDRAEILLRLTDANDNVTEKSWVITQGPTGAGNHSPVVDESVDISLDQYGSVVFDVSFFDEDGDTPLASAVNLPLDHYVSDLGDGKFLYTPSASFYGELQFSLLWSDGFGGNAVTVVNATVNEVTASRVRGDINNDGSVTFEDLILSLRIFTGNQITETLEKANAVSTSKISINDAIYILNDLSNSQ